MQMKGSLKVSSVATVDDETEQLLRNFYESITKKRKRLGISQDPAWYRGHSHDKYQLCPSLFRQESLRLVDERNIYTTFLTEGRSHIPNYADDWSVLAIMQHFKVPTRLLDWTDSLHVALFFAIMFTSYENPHIWILNPYRLNARFRPDGRVIYGEAEKPPFEYYESLRQGAWPYELPIAIAPSWVSSRVAAQRGYFTVHGSDRRPIDQTAGSCVEKVLIPERIIPRLLNDLYHAGADEGRLFPDLEGLAASIRRRLRLKR
jgi:hypothetical protein